MKAPLPSCVPDDLVRIGPCGWVARDTHSRKNDAVRQAPFSELSREPTDVSGCDCTSVILTLDQKRERQKTELDATADIAKRNIEFSRPRNV
jgi:hypothetical protein